MANTFSMDDRRHWTMNVIRKFDKFWKIKLPCPVDPVEDIYRQAYSTAEWEAMHLLRADKPNALSQSSSFSLYWTEDTSGTSQCPHATFKFGNNLVLPNFGVELDKLPQHVQGRVRHWITNVQYFRSLSQELEARCKAVMGNPTGTGSAWQTRRRKDLDPCLNTPGQLFRLWPDVQPVMMSDWKRVLQLASVKSKVPDRIGFHVLREGRKQWATPEQFLCLDSEATDTDKHRFKQINHILCMVSMADEVKDPKGYPVFHGDVWSN